MNLKEEDLAAVLAIPASKEKVFITSNNKTILLPLSAIPIQGRMTSGVKVIDSKSKNIIMEI